MLFRSYCTVSERECGFATIVFSTFFLLYLYMLFLILIFNGCFFECPAVKMLVGPSAPPMIEIEIAFLLFCSIRLFIHLFLTNTELSFHHNCKQNQVLISDIRNTVFRTFFCKYGKSLHLTAPLDRHKLLYRYPIRRS